MQTRKYPRSMSEAFGPYTSRDLQPMQDPPRPIEPARLVLGAVYIAAALVLSLILIGVIA